jgi:DNA ligase-1
MAYDLLEHAGTDVRTRPQHERRQWLEAGAGTALLLSPVERRDSWAGLAELRGESRQRGVEGFMLKRGTPPMGWAAPRPMACGGSGRSSRCASTAC